MSGTDQASDQNGTDSAADREAEKPSKSARKRELEAVAALARELLALPQREFLALPLAADTRSALTSAAGMQRRAGQRQFRYACGILARDDLERIRAALGAGAEPRRETVRIQHELENWRDRLIAGDPELSAALAARYTALDPRELERLIRQARAERGATRPPAAARKLFRYLREIRGPSAE